MTASLRNRVVSHCTVKTNSNNGEGEKHTRMPRSCQLLPQLRALVWRATVLPLSRGAAQFGVGELSTEHRTCVSAPYPDCPELRERERKHTGHSHAIHTHATITLPGLLPLLRRGAKAGHAGEGSGCSRGCVCCREGLAGHSFWAATLAVWAAGPGLTCWRAAPGLETAACSWPPPHQARSPVLLVANLHLPSRTFPP